MNRGEFQTSLVQQMIWSGTGSGGGNTATASNDIMSSFKSCHEDQETSPNLPSLSSPSMLFSQQFLHTGTSSGQLGHTNGGAAGSLPSLHDGGSGQEHHMPESWSQMLL
jgi:hypothetical protein